MDNQLYILSEVLLNYNPEPCIHFDKLFKPLYLTCKTFYNKYFSEKWKLFNCDICHFREIICIGCKLSNTKSCIHCKCLKCGISINLTGGSINYRNVCNRCRISVPLLIIDYVTVAYNIRQIYIKRLNDIMERQIKLIMNKTMESTMKKLDESRAHKININNFNLINNLHNFQANQLLQDNIEQVTQNKKEEIVIKNIKIANFESTKYFQYKKIKNIKNNYKHNGQQFRRQNQLKQPR